MTANTSSPRSDQGASPKKLVDIEERPVFGYGPGADGSTVLLLGIPRRAWETMQDGHAKDLDLTGIGLPVKLLIFGADDHASVMKVINASFAEAGVPVLDERRRDFSIKAPR